MMNNLNKKSAVICAQLTQLISASKTAILVSLISSAIFAVVMSNVIQLTSILLWLLAVVIVAVIRLILFNKYMHMPVGDSATIQARLNIFRMGALISGLTWGVTGILFFAANNAQYQLFLIFTLFVVSAGILVSYAVDRISSISFSLAVMLPLVTRLFMAGDKFSVAMGTFGLVYFGYMYVGVTLINKRMLQNFVMQFEAGEREKIIASSAELNKSILQTALHGFLLADRAGRLLQANSAYCQKSGYSEQELLAMGVEDLCALESPDKLARSEEHTSELQSLADE
jgi:PAS domain-containing protein